MNQEKLVKNLQTLKLGAIARDFIEVARVAEKKNLTYEDYLALLTEAEINRKRLNPHTGQSRLTPTRTYQESGFVNNT